MTESELTGRAARLLSVHFLDTRYEAVAGRLSGPAYRWRGGMLEECESPYSKQAEWKDVKGFETPREAVAWLLAGANWFRPYSLPALINAAVELESRLAFWEKFPALPHRADTARFGE